MYDHFGGWTGGSGLGKEGGTAYWGGYPDHVEALEFILTKNQEKQQAKNREKGKANAEVMTKFLSNFKQAAK